MDFHKTTPNPNPYSRANFVSKHFFWWLVPLFLKGWKGNLKQSDIYDCPDEDRSDNLSSVLQREWENELEKLKSDQYPSLLKASFRAFGLRYCLSGITLAFQHLFVNVVQPLLMGLLIKHFARISLLSFQELCLRAAGMCLLAAVFLIAKHHHFFEVAQIGMQFRIACSILLYKKALKLSQASLSSTTVGQIVNLLSNDISKCEQCIAFLLHLVTCPIQAVIIIWVLWPYIGYASLAGVSFTILYGPFQGLMVRLFSKLRMKTAILTDERIRLMNEIIGGMRVIKMYAWEIPFANLVDLSRRKEVKKIRRKALLQSVNLAFSNMASKIMLLVTFVVFVLGVKGDLTPDKVFISMALFYNLKSLMAGTIPIAITQGSEAIVSLKRVQTFLLMEEQSSTSRLDVSTLRPKLDQCGTWINNMSASFNKNSEATLRNVSLSVKPGELLVVIGPIGSGKSSLLMSILGELSITYGQVKVHGKVVFASQEHWVIDGSIRQNILFGSDFNEEKYKKVLNLCSLNKDIELLPYGDQTTVGERGVLLSGGQKARINLARAIYFDADVFLLDDPLSAVDSSVAKHLFKNCINGYLKDKVRILVTHQIQFLKEASQILVLKDGCCLARGTYQQLTESGVDLRSYIGHYKPEQEQTETPLTSVTPSSCNTDIVAEDYGSKTPISLWKSTLSNNSSVQEHGKDNRNEKTPTICEENKSSGSVSFRVYKEYVKSGAGIFLRFFILISCFGTQVLFSGSDFWLASWTNLEQLKINIRDCWSQANKTLLNETGFYGETFNATILLEILPRADKFCYHITQNYTVDYHDADKKIDMLFQLLIYAGIVLATYLLFLMKTASFFTMCMKASITLHNKMFCSILWSPISFFENNPIGRVLNRFAKDTGVLDETLPMLALDAITKFSYLFGILCVVAIVEPYMILPTVILAIIFLYLRKFYIPTARDIKRYEGIARSPIYTQLSVSLQGLTTIRAFKVQPMFVACFNHYQDQHTATWFAFLSVTRWLGVVLEWLYVLYLTIVTITVVHFSGDPSYASRAGLAITSALQICSLFQWGVRQLSEAEIQMTSVERIIEYSHLNPETAPVTDKGNYLPKNWPDKGHIVYKDVNLRYAANKPPVLKNLNFEIYPKEKIGIVGRTGAGKSSIITTLLRMTEPEGIIKVDGVTTKDIRLQDLRKNISIIPQDPILFTTTIRRNFDPFGQHSDIELWQALEEAYLKKTVDELPEGLNTKVSEGGVNFSVGQRQLICLARAIIRRKQILVLDEATANVDPNTDRLIQQTIRDRFAHCTVLTIAHRLHTIMDSDRVLLLDAGEIKEFDDPYTLLQNPDSLFSLMVQMTGPSMSKQLKDVAYAAHLNKISNAENRGDSKNIDGCGGNDETEMDGTSSSSRIRQTNARFTDGLVNESYEHNEQTF